MIERGEIEITGRIEVLVPKCGSLDCMADKALAAARGEVVPELVHLAKHALGVEVQKIGERGDAAVYRYRAHYSSRR